MTVAIRSLFLLLSAAVFIVAVRSAAPAHTAAPHGDPIASVLPPPPADWPMFGGGPGRNMVNPKERQLPDAWNLEKRLRVKWVARLGSRSYGGPVVAGGKVFVGTNNENPRNRRDIKRSKGGDTDEPIDRGILMCFRESD